MIGLTVGAATVALAGCSGGGDESDDENTGSGSPENESGTGPGEEPSGNDSEEDTETVAEEDGDGNDTEDDAAAESEAKVVAVGPEESPTMFEPETLTVESGTTVTFEWVTDNHNIVVESQPEDGDWDGQEEIENTGYTHEHTFEADGEYEYICEPHAPDMRGVVVVEGGMDGSADDSGNGTDDPENPTEDPTNSTEDPENGSDTDSTQ